jgi:hypothetical protein
VVDIENDLGGRENLSTLERALIEAFAGRSVTLNNLNVRLVQGEPIGVLPKLVFVSVRV